MFKDKLIGKALSSVDLPLTVNRSRCLRMRFNKNGCAVCTSNCNFDALAFRDDIVIDPGKCTLCMVCVSECPADCFDIEGEDFFSVLAKLRRVQNSVAYPTLGCKTASRVDAHEKITCLGALSEKHLIAIKNLIDKPVFLNLTRCSGCKNSFIVDTLKKRISAIKKNSGVDVSDKVLPVEHESDLQFEDISYDRRGFFSAMKNLTFLRATALFAKEDREITKSYSQKKIPIKQDIFNTIIKTIKDEDIRARLLHEYAFTITAGDSCDNCFACVGMCSTGALKIKSDDSGLGLLFNSSMCNGCGLCRDFCINEAVVLSQGYYNDKFFEYEICGKISESIISEKDRHEDAVEAECYDVQ